MKIRTGIKAGDGLCQKYTEMKRNHEKSVQNQCRACDNVRETCRVCDMERQKLAMTNWDETLKSFC